MRKLIIGLTLAMLPLAATAAAAMAFVHAAIPGDDCANLESAGNAGNNSTAKNALAATSVGLPVGNSQAGNDCSVPE